MSAATVEGRTVRGLGRVLRTGAVVTVAAAAATGVAAALAGAAGVSFRVQGGEQVPASGIAFITGICSVAGVVVAAALVRWSSRPTMHLAWTTGLLTAASLVPPLAWADDTATMLTLVGLHLLAAAVVVPALLRAVGRAVRTG